MFNPKVDHIRQSIISILNDDNKIIGYGFFIDPYGTAITSYHIIAALTHIRIRDHDENIYEATIDEYHTRDNVDISDIAVLQVPKETPIFLHIGPNTKDPKEITIVQINESGLEFKDILHEPDRVLHHSPDLHGLPATITHTTIAIGLLGSTDRWPKLSSIKQLGKSVQLNMLFLSLSDKYCPDKHTPHDREIKNLLNTHLQNTVKKLIDKKIILPNYYQEAERTTDDLIKFLESDKHTFFLYGESGTGKTSVLINTAVLFADGYFTLFLSATDLDPLADGLPGKIKPFLNRLLAQHPDYTITADDIMNLIYQQPQKFLIIIDGLNQMPRRPKKFFNDWFKRSTRWARGLNLKIIFSSTYSSAENHTYRTYGFYASKIKMVHARHELPDNFKYISRTHHPMLIRLLHDISSKERSAPLDDYPLLSTYLARRCTAIGRRADLPSKTIHTILLDIAKYFSATGDYWLPHATYQHIVKDYPQLSSILIQENIFLESINGIRIINDWIADFLIGEALTPDVDWEQFLNTSSHTERKGMAWSLARLSYQGQDLSLPLQNLLTFIWENNTYQRKAVNIFINTVRHLSNPDRYYQLIESFFFSEQNNYFEIKLIGPLVYYSHLSFANQLKLINLTLSADYLRPKQIEWYLGFIRLPDYMSVGELYPTKYILSRYITTSPEKTFAIIADWLYESDNMMINIIAAILFTQFYKIPKYKFEQIPLNKRSQDTPAQVLLQKNLFTLMVATQRYFRNALVGEWTKRRVYKTRVLNDSSLYIQWITPLIPKIFRSMKEVKEKIPAIVWLIRIPDYRREMIGELLTLLKEGKMPVRVVGELTPYVLNEEYFDIIVPMLVKYIGYGAHYDVRKECIPVLFQFGSNENQNVILAKNLVILIREGLSDLHALLTDQLVLGLCMMPATSETYKILLASLPSLLVRDLKIWYRITKHLCRREKCYDKRHDKIRLINWGLEFLPVRTRCTVVILLLDMEIIKDEDIIFEMIKPTILETLSESEQFYDAVLKKCAKKNQIALFHDVMNDVELKAVSKL